MSHTRRHIIVSAFRAYFSDSEVRSAFTESELAEIDGILAQEEHSRRDVRNLFTFAESAAFSDD